ncbi:MAG: iron chelate uptake ABC transporter family permease subunit [Nitrososphaerota archaeon]
MALDLLALIYLSAAANGLLVGAISLPLIISRSTLFALTMTHAVLGGAILGIYVNEVLGVGLPIQLTAFLVALMLSILVAELSEKFFSEDVSIALAIALATTITVVFSYLLARISPAGLSQAWSYVAGTSAVATLSDLQRTLSSLAIIVPLIHMTSGEIKYISFDRDGAAALGLNTRAYRYLFFALGSLAASTLSMSIGVLATHVLLAIPGAIAVKLFRRKLFTASYLSAACLSLGGYALAQALNIPPSGGIGILSAIAILGMVVAREA